MALGGGVHRLARQIGLKRAMGLILTGEIVNGTAAMDLGFITALVVPEEFEAAIADWCARILRGAPLALRASKQSVMRGLDAPGLAAALEAQEHWPAYAAWYASADRHEGALAFAEKRPPRWQGR